VKKAQKVASKLASANSFEAVAREWFEVWRKGASANHAKAKIARLERDVFPWLGRLPVTEITTPVVLGLLHRIEAKGYGEVGADASCGVTGMNLAVNHLARPG
jgi:hypothetical protein